MVIGKITSYSNLELALMVLLNYLGAGTNRKKILGSRYKEVQDLVNEIIRTGVIKDGNSNITIEELNKVLLNLEPSHEEYLSYIDDIIDKVKEGTK